MMHRLTIAFAMLLCAACNQQPPAASLELSEALGGVAEAGFARALAPRTFIFPDDHGAHPAFRNEWWYFTGNLFTEQGRQFGYQVTLFRIGLATDATDAPDAIDEADASESASQWATNQIWMAHVALTDVQNGEHDVDQRLARAAAGLAGQKRQPFRVWLEDWQITGGGNGEFPWSIDVKTETFTLQLEIQPVKPVVLQGEAGLSRKSAAPGNASYYYSLPRLRTAGSIARGGAEYPVSGWSWLDREWSTSALADDQVGWDWFSLQLHDGHDLMFYQLRKRDGSADEHSSGTWIAPDGAVQPLNRQAVRLQPLRYWQGYPVSWSMALPELGRAWRIDALIDDQEMAVGIRYWEGAVRISDIEDGALRGYGYLEMTGYHSDGLAELRDAD